MKVIVFGATGMVGQGVLRECLIDAGVEAVLTVGRKETGQKHDKLRDLVHENFYDFSTIAGALSGWDACFFCLGVSSAGMTEADYQRVTYDVTVAAAEVLSRQNPGMTFIYVSGAGTDTSERGRSMWARVKGKTENALLRMPFKAVYLFRPGYIQPLHGITSKTKLYRAIYALMGPLFPVWNRLFPKFVTTTERVGRAMIEIAEHGAAKRVFENRDINEVGSASRDRARAS